MRPIEADIDLDRPVRLAYDDDMTVDVVSEVVIERPCAEVAEYAVNPNNAEPSGSANLLLRS
jgi:hypothetical protein